ncbi:MAG TPA: UbiA family prenyltransferase, partial [Anaerolineales bacterium]|nr:UbiA family prenyltransferase [Anaerolineales bacterium]
MTQRLSPLQSMVRSVSGVMQLVRVETCVQAGLFTLFGAYLGSDRSGFITATTVTAALCVVFTTAASFAINDWWDHETDALGHARRAIPSGKVSRRAALAITAVTAAAALILSAWLEPALRFLVAFNLVVSGVYSIRLKGTVLAGNLTIAYLNASMLLFGGLAVGSVTPRLWAPILLTFLFTLPQEVLYDLRDEKADAAIGMRTTAVGLGGVRTRRLLLGLFGVFAAAAVGVTALSRMPVLYIVAVLICIGP